jgi:hypothetical protein
MVFLLIGMGWSYFMLYLINGFEAVMKELESDEDD